MNICIPTQDDLGAAARVSSHFGSAPFYTVVDTATGVISVVLNRHVHHEHGQCRPRDVLRTLNVDAVIAIGLGQRALIGLNADGVKVYQTKFNRVEDVLKTLDLHMLNEMKTNDACVKEHHHGNDDRQSGAGDAG
jgi:predicted Fe-Mo cluster-binding NifX family protein